MATVAVLALVAAACSKKSVTATTPPSGPTSGGAKPEVDFAFFGALSGDYKLLVIHGFQAAQLAFDQANAAGDLPVKVVLVPEDTQGSGDQAAPLVDKVVNDSKFVGVIGPAFSGESAAVGDRLDQAGLPFITTSATDDALSTHGWTHWFRGVGDNSDEAKPAGQYIENVLKPNCTFVASDGSAYGKGLAAIVESNLAGDAIIPVKPEQDVQPAQKSYLDLVTKVKASGCTAFFYGGYSPEAGLIRKQLTGLNPPKPITMLGGDGIKDETFTSTAGTAGEGTLSICPCSDIVSSTDPVAQKFVSDYKAKYSTDPGIYAAEGWDIAQMYIAAMKAGKTDRQSITDFITNLQGFHGLTKDYTFQPNGELFPTSRTMFVYQDKSGAWAYLGDAATLVAGG